jgi:polyisoprenoid-binding protein YceI
MRRLQSLYFAALFLLLPVLALAANWEFDPAHSSAYFKVRHMMISTVNGTFPGVTGVVVIDDADLSRSSVKATIDAKSIDTSNHKRDEHLRSADFLDVATYPAITFISTSVQTGPGENLKVTGDLTIHGVTRAVVLDGTLTPEIKDPFGNMRRGAELSTQLDRKEFGLVWNKVMETGGLLVGDEVKVTIQAELIQK